MAILRAVMAMLSIWHFQHVTYSTWKWITSTHTLAVIPIIRATRLNGDKYENRLKGVIELASSMADKFVTDITGCWVRQV